MSNKACSFYVPEVPGEEDGDKIKMYSVPFSSRSVDDFFLLQFLREVAQLFRAKSMEEDGARKLSFLRLLLIGNALWQFEGLYTVPPPGAELDDHAKNEAAAERAAQDLLNVNAAVDNAFHMWIHLRLPDNSGGPRTVKKELRKMKKPQSMDGCWHLFESSHGGNQLIDRSVVSGWTSVLHRSGTTDGDR